MVNKKHERKKILETYTKKDILKAVIQILTQHGIQDFSMERVAQEAGVAKGTLYVHFKNKKQIIESAVEASLAPLLEELSDVLDSNLPPDKKLERFTFRHLSYFDAHQDFFRVLLYDRQRAHAQRRRYGTSLYWTFVEKITRVVDDGIQSGLFRPLDPSKVAVMFTEATIAVAINRLWSKSSENIEEDARLISEVILHGITAETTNGSGTDVIT